MMQIARIDPHLANTLLTVFDLAGTFVFASAVQPRSSSTSLISLAFSCCASQRGTRAALRGTS
jgi:hypothetical protein